MEQTPFRILFSLFEVSLSWFCNGLSGERFFKKHYERSNLSIYQRKWDANEKANIQPILPMENEPSAQSAAQRVAANQKASVIIIVAATVGGVVLIFILAGFIAVIRRQNKKLRALKEKEQPLPEPIKLSKDEIATFATDSTIPELDGIDTLLMNPELEAKPIHELPANEAVDSELYSPASQVKSASLRQRELEYQRNVLRQAQFSQRRRHVQDDPHFGFGSIAQTVMEQAPQFQTPTWTVAEGEGAGRIPLTRAWSDPSVSPKTCTRQYWN